MGSGACLCACCPLPSGLASNAAAAGRPRTGAWPSPPQPWRSPAALSSSSRAVQACAAAPCATATPPASRLVRPRRHCVSPRVWRRCSGCAAAPGARSHRLLQWHWQRHAAAVGPAPPTARRANTPQFGTQGGSRSAHLPGTRGRPASQAALCARHLHAPTRVRSTARRFTQSLQAPAQWQYGAAITDRLA